MTVEVLCPHCGASYNISQEKIGKSARCKKCEKAFALQSSAVVTQGSQAALETGQRSNQSSRHAPRDEAGRTSTPQKLGRFEIRSKLGAGAFGTVYRAYDPLLDREVALKVPNPAVLENEKDKARYLREPKAAAQLRHPNIVPIFDAGFDDERVFIASAFIDGQTLQRRIEEARPDLREAATLVMKLASALHYAHEQGIVHRDVKPANIMLDKKGEPLLMDFGLAQIREVEDKLTHDGQVLGTPAYMSPEQARADSAHIGPASDQYSLGVVLYELLCGERPFSGPPALVISLVRDREPASPKAYNPRLPQDLETICLKSMAKDAHRRYASCQELAADLRRWECGEPIRARSIGVAERVMRWCRRNKAVTAAIAVATMALLGVVCVVAASALRIAVMARSEHASNLRAEAEALAAEKNAAVARQETERAAREAAEAALARELAKTETEKAKQADLAAAERRKEADESKKQAQESALAAKKEEERANEEARLAWQAKYPESIQRVGNAMQSGDSAFARSLLDSLRPAAGQEDLRGFEWHHYWRATHPGQVTMQMESPIQRIAISPDSSLVAAIDWKSLVLWDCATGKQVAVLDNGTSFEGRPRCVMSFTADGKSLVVAQRHYLPGAGAKYEVHVSVWNVLDRKRTSHSEHPVETVGDLELTHDGRWLAIKEIGHRFQIWDVAAAKVRSTADLIRENANFSKIEHLLYNREVFLTIGTTDIELRSLKSGAVKKSHSGRLLAVSPLAHRIAVADAAQISILDDATLNTIFTHSQPAPSGRAAAFAPDGETLAVGDKEGIKVWNLRSNAVIAVLPAGCGKSSAESLSFSPDGRTLAVVANKHLRLWKLLAVGLEEVRLVGPFKNRDWPEMTNHTPDGKNLAWSSGAKLKSRSPLVVSEPGNVVAWLEFDEIKDGNRAESIEFYDLDQHARGASLLIPRGGVWRLAIAPAGDLVAFGSMRDNELRHRVKGTTLKLAAQDKLLHNCRFSHDGAILGSYYEDGSVRLWNTTSGQLLRTLPLNRRVRSVDFSPRGDNLAITTEASGTLLSKDIHETKLWNVGTEKELLPLYTGTDILKCVMFTEDGATAATIGYSKAWLSSVESGKLKGVISIETRLNRQLTGAAFSPDGTKFATAYGDRDNAANPGDLRVWDIAQNKTLRQFTGHPGAVYAVAFSPDGQSLASGGGDARVRLWNVETGQERMRFPDCDGPVHFVRFRPGGNSLMAISAKRTLYVWHADSEAEVIAWVDDSM